MRSVRVPPEFLLSTASELVVRFTEKAFGAAEASIKLSDLPLEAPSRVGMLEEAFNLRESDPATALKIYEAAIEAFPEESTVLQAAALFLATTEAPKLRNPERALVWARKSVELTGEEDEKSLDTLVVTLHANGQLEEALKLAQRGAESIKSYDLFQRAKAYEEELQSQK